MSSIDDGWLEAAIAWEVCASLHRQYCNGKDALFTTRQADFVKHAEAARLKATAAPQQEPSCTSVQLAEMVLSDCGHSSSYTPLLNRVAARIDAHVERWLESKTTQREAQSALFDKQGFHEWVLLNLPYDTIIGNSAYWADHLSKVIQHFVKAAPAEKGNAPVPRDWFPVDGNTRGYEGDIVLRHYKQKDQYRLSHTNWIGDHEVTPYSPAGTAKPVAAWKSTIENMGLDAWMPLGDFAAQAAPVDVAVQQDAERYRYLRDGVLVDGEVNEDLYVHVDHQSYQNRWALVGLELDEAIDAARKEMPCQKE